MKHISKDACMLVSKATVRVSRRSSHPWLELSASRPGPAFPCVCVCVCVSACVLFAVQEVFLSHLAREARRCSGTRSTLKTADLGMCVWLLAVCGLTGSGWRLGCVPHTVRAIQRNRAFEFLKHDIVTAQPKAAILYDTGRLWAGVWAGAC